MGPCKDCGQWHCVCEHNPMRELIETRAARVSQIHEHRFLKARHDPAFLRFLNKLLPK